MKIKEFIEAAIEGGYNTQGYNIWWIATGDLTGELVPSDINQVKALILDPEAWKAVGKVKGWQRMTKGPEPHVIWSIP